MASLTPKQKHWAIILGVLIYAALMALLFGWLAFNGEDTTQRRVAQTSTVVVSLLPKDTKVPGSWTQEQQPAATQPDAVMPPEAAPPTAEQPAAPAAVEQPAAEAPKPEEKTEPKAEDATSTEVAPAAQTSAVETPTAEATQPVTTEAPAAATTEPTTPAVTAQLPWHKFARPFDASDSHPRIALIISDLGFASAATQTAVQDMPGEVTLAFSSMAPDVEGWIAKARAAGHESLLTVPMEPDNYPKNDPGPNTLLLSLSDKDNVSRIRWALSRGEGFVGVMPYMGEKFVTSEEKLAPVMDVVNQEGLMVVDGTLNKNSLIPALSRLGKMPFVRSDILVDASAARAAIEGQLDALEKTAREKGQAVGVALPYPVTFEKIKVWIPTLKEKGIILAPITAIASTDAPAAPAAAPVEAVPPAANPEEVQ